MNETDEKTQQVTPNRLDFMGVPITSRYGVLSEISVMLQFCELLSNYDAFQYIESLSYDSKSGICTIHVADDTPRGDYIEEILMVSASMTLPLYSLFGEIGSGPQFRLGQIVRKTKGAEWSGHVCGFYGTTLNPCGYCVESEFHAGSVQLYPGSMLEAVEDPTDPALH